LISLLFLRILAFAIIIISLFILISLIVILVSLMKENFFRPLVNETLVNIILYSLIIAIFSVPYLIILLKVKSKQEISSFREIKSIYS
jgi:divalent metal cation (Fe/Co/Zn/Cd) transporter